MKRSIVRSFVVFLTCWSIQTGASFGQDTLILPGSSEASPLPLVDPMWPEPLAIANDQLLNHDQSAKTFIDDGLSEPTPQRVIRSAPVEPWCFELLPDGLMWRSYLAAPHEPRISTMFFNTSDNDAFCDATVGGRVGLMRYGSQDAARPQGWQWDLEGAVMTRLDLKESQDVESMDYRFGTQITRAEGPWAAKFGYFHISSHIGDEYLLRLALTERQNYVTESWVLGTSYTFADVTRLYGEFVNSFHTAGGAQRYQYQTGIEYAPIPRIAKRGAPFAAINLNFREAVDYDVSTTLQGGWLFQGPRSGRRMRFGLEYGDGPTTQYSFFQRRESYIGFGTWFDF